MTLDRFSKENLLHFLLRTNITLHCTESNIYGGKCYQTTFSRFHCIINYAYKLWYSNCVLEEVTIFCQHLTLSMSLKIHSENGLGNLTGLLGVPRKPAWRWNLKFFFHAINF